MHESSLVCLQCVSKSSNDTFSDKSHEIVSNVDWDDVASDGEEIVHGRHVPHVAGSQRSHS